MPRETDSTDFRTTLEAPRLAAGFPPEKCPSIAEEENTNFIAEKSKSSRPPVPRQSNRRVPSVSRRKQVQPNCHYPASRAPSPLPKQASTDAATSINRQARMRKAISNYYSRKNDVISDEISTQIHGMSEQIRALLQCESNKVSKSVQTSPLSQERKRACRSLLSEFSGSSIEEERLVDIHPSDFSAEIRYAAIVHLRDEGNAAALDGIVNAISNRGLVAQRKTLKVVDRLRRLARSGANGGDGGGEERSRGASSSADRLVEISQEVGNRSLVAERKPLSITNQLRQILQFSEVNLCQSPICSSERQSRASSEHSSSENLCDSPICSSHRSCHPSHARSCSPFGSNAMYHILDSHRCDMHLSSWAQSDFLIRRETYV